MKLHKFGIFDVPHAVPIDDFEHVVSKDNKCGCNPEIQNIPDLGAVVIHRTLKFDSLNEDTFPEEWLNND